jgi:cytochrome bd-type quinol oxidase subunit 2
MAAGIPGSGLGGFFYLLSALLMPVQESVCLCCKKSNRTTRRTVLRQVMNAGGVLCGVWLTGWFIGRVFTIIATSTPSSLGHRTYAAIRYNNFGYGLAVLLFVFLFVQVLSAILRQVHYLRKHPSKTQIAFKISK